MQTNSIKTLFSAAFLLINTLLLTACTADTQSFSSRPGFSEHFKKYKPVDTIPDQRERDLLIKFQPKIYRSVNKNGIVQQGPINFYKSFISKGKLLADDEMVSQQVTAEILNEYSDSVAVKFEYSGTYRSDTDAVVYGRFDQDTLSFNDTDYPLEFLSYNLVFPASGIIKGLGTLQSLALTIAGSLNDWHQLDHYVGMSIALYQQQPVAITLQQHNYHTTFVLGQDFRLPEDNRIQVDIAMRSNELYLHNKTEVQHPAVSFITAKNIEFLKNGTNKPLMAGFDITRGDQEVNYSLLFLPQSDAFYQFKGQLGKSRLLPGRDGPPGADYATLPGLMPRAVRMVTGFRPGTVELEKQKLNALFDLETFSINPDALTPYISDFIKAVPLSK